MLRGFEGMFCILLLLVSSSDVLPMDSEEKTGRQEHSPKAGVEIKPSGGASRLTFSSDGKILAVANRDGDTVGLYDPVTGQQKSELKWRDNGVVDLQFSPDGRTLLVNGMGKRIRLWKVDTGELKATLTALKDFLGPMRISPDGQMVATVGSDEKTIKLWDIATGQLKSTLELPKEESRSRVTDLAYSPDGTILIVSSFFKIYLWDAATWQLKTTLVRQSSDSSPVYKLRFSPDGRVLAISGPSRIAALQDMEKNELKVMLVGHEKNIFGMTFSPDGRTLVTQSFDKTAKLWDVSTGQLKATITEPKDEVWSVAFSPDGRLLATTGKKNNVVKLWDTATMQIKVSIESASSPTIAFSPDGKTLAVQGKDRTVTLWDISSIK